MAVGTCVGHFFYYFLTLRTTKPLISKVFSRLINQRSNRCTIINRNNKHVERVSFFISDLVGQLLYKSTITLSSTNILIHSDHHPAQHTVNNNMETHNNTFKYWRRLKRKSTAVIRACKTPLTFFYIFSGRSRLGIVLILFFIQRTVRTAMIKGR